MSTVTTVISLFWSSAIIKVDRFTGWSVHQGTDNKRTNQCLLVNLCLCFYSFWKLLAIWMKNIFDTDNYLQMNICQTHGAPVSEAARRLRDVFSQGVELRVGQDGLHRVSQLFLPPRPGPEWISCSHWVTAAPCLFTSCWTAVAAAASVPVRHSSRGRVSAEARLMAQLFNPAVKRLLLNWHLLRWIFDQFHQRLMGIDGSKGRDRTICGNQWSLGRRTRVPLFVLVKTSAL